MNDRPTLPSTGTALVYNKVQPSSSGTASLISRSDETEDARERREFTTSLGALMLGQLAHAIATWRLAGSARSSSALRGDDDGRAVRATDTPPAEARRVGNGSATQYAGEGDELMALQDCRKGTSTTLPLVEVIGPSGAAHGEGSASDSPAVARTTSFAGSALSSKVRVPVTGASTVVGRDQHDGRIDDSAVLASVPPTGGATSASGQAVSTAVPIARRTTMSDERCLHGLPIAFACGLCRIDSRIRLPRSAFVSGVCDATTGYSEHERCRMIGCECSCHGRESIGDALGRSLMVLR